MAVSLHVTHSTLADLNAEIKLLPALTIAELKKKLVGYCGTDPQHMHLTLMDESGRVVAALEDDGEMLSANLPRDGWKIYVVDMDPNSIAASLSDSHVVEKVTLSNEAAAARKAEFAKFKASKPKSAVNEEHLADAAAALVVGSSCSANGKQGTVRYVGKIPEIAPGWWVGVEYTEAVGKNDGSVKGARYFTCPPEMGGFLRPDKLEQ